MLDLTAMFGLNQELLIIVVIVLLLFGGSKIPELMKGLGTGMKEFKKGLNEEDDADKEAKKADKAEAAKKE
jgi:sec-independent protein translocase protein TatA